MSKIRSISTLMKLTQKGEEIVLSIPMGPCGAFKVLTEELDTPCKFLSRVWFDSPEIFNRYESRGKKDLTGLDHLIGADHYENGGMMLAFFLDEGTAITPIMLAFYEPDGSIDVTFTEVYRRRAEAGYYAQHLTQEELIDMAKYAFDNFEKCFRPEGANKSVKPLK